MKLVVHNLAVARGGVALLQGVSFAVDAGQALVLRGPNGSGKTTLLRTIAGLQPALDGTIEAPSDSMAYGAHSDGLKAMLSVSENLEFWADMYGTGPIDAALQAFDMTALRDRLAQNLSAGQKRRLGLARLLVMDRPIWVLDEPTVSLDVQSVGLFAAAVDAHLGQGGIALMATHIDLGIQTQTLEMSPFKARSENLRGAFDEAFT